MVKKLIKYSAFTLAGTSLLVASFLAGRFSNNTSQRTCYQNTPSISQIQEKTKEKEEPSHLIKTIYGTNLLDTDSAKDFSLEPGNYEVRPHPYKPDTFFIRKSPSDSEESLEKIVFDSEGFETGEYLMFVEKKDFIYPKNREPLARFTISHSNKQKQQSRKISELTWGGCGTGNYEICIQDQEKKETIKLRSVRLNEGDKIKFVREK